MNKYNNKLHVLVLFLVVWIHRRVLRMSLSAETVCVYRIKQSVMVSTIVSTSQTKKIAVRIAQ